MKNHFKKKELPMGISLPVKFYAVEEPFFIEPERKKSVL
jgi:hypothetical protein